jgi:hypothetical protein
LVWRARETPNVAMLQKYFNSYASLVPIIAVYVVCLRKMTSLGNVAEEFSKEFVTKNNISLAPVPVPDLRFLLYPQELVGLLEAYGPQGRAAYLLCEQIDFIYMMAYPIVFSVIARWINPRSNAQWIPYLILLADIVENSAIISCIHSPTITVATIASIGNFFKWSFVIVTVLSLPIAHLQRQN